MKTKKDLIVYILIGLGIVVLINILSDRFFFRLDFTEDSRYTLNKGTKSVLDSLQETVTVTAYFSDKLPTEYVQIRNDFKDLLSEYSSRSKRKVMFEFVNPNETEETKAIAQQEGIQILQAQKREEDQMTQQVIFMGAVIKIGENKEVIPYIQSSQTMEYELTRCINKLTNNNKPVVGFLQGHGELSMRSIMQLEQELGYFCQIEPVTQNDSVNNLLKYTTVCIIASKDSFPQTHFRQLDEFLAQGKNLLVAINRVKAEFQSQQALPLTTGLETWLSQKDINVENNMVTDDNCSQITVQQQNGPFSFQQQMRFQYLPIITRFAENSITKGIEAIVLPFASAMTFSGNKSLTFTPVAFTSAKAGKESVPFMFNLQKQWTAADFNSPGSIVAATLEGNIAGNLPSKMFVVTDGDFVDNGEGQNPNPVNPDNINLFSNALDWLEGQTGFVELRTKEVMYHPLITLEKGEKNFWKYFNFLFPIFLIVGFGIFRLQMNRTKRMKRMEERYV